MHAIVHGCQWYSRWEASCSFAHSNGKQTYTLLRSLLVPAKPSDKSFQDIANTLKCHFDPKPLVIVERFYFHRQDQAEVESISDYLATSGDPLRIWAIPGTGSVRPPGVWYSAWEHTEMIVTRSELDLNWSSRYCKKCRSCREAIYSVEGEGINKHRPSVENLYTGTA